MIFLRSSRKSSDFSSGTAPLRPAMPLILSAIAGKRTIRTLRSFSSNAAEQIVAMPSGHEDDHPAEGGEASHEIVDEPGPGAVADGFRVGLGPALDRVVDNAEISVPAR